MEKEGSGLVRKAHLEVLPSDELSDLVDALYRPEARKSMGRLALTSEVKVPLCVGEDWARGYCGSPDLDAAGGYQRFLDEGMQALEGKPFYAMSYLGYRHEPGRRLRVRLAFKAGESERRVFDYLPELAEVAVSGVLWAIHDIPEGKLADKSAQGIARGLYEARKGLGANHPAIANRESKMIAARPDLFGVIDHERGLVIPPDLRSV